MGALLSPYLYLSMRKLVGEKAALYGAFISASSLEIIVLARSSVTDATLTFTLTVALISFLRKEYIPAYIFCGLSLLAKGPIGFGFPALIVGLWMIFSGSFTFKNIMALGWTWGIPLACLVGLPWYLAMGMIHGDAFIDTFLGYHNVTRFISPEHAGQNHYWLYLVVLIAGFYPWTGTLPGILRRLRKWRADPVLFYLIVWALFIFLFFTLSSTQLFSYILPMFPPLSLLAGKYLTDQRSGACFQVPHGLPSLFCPDDSDRHQPRAACTRRRRYSEIRHFPFHDTLCSLFCPHAVKGAYARLPLLAGLPYPSLRDIRLGPLCCSRFQSLHLEGHCRDALGNRKGA